MEERKAGEWRNEGGEAGRGEHGVKEWGMEEGKAGKWRNEGGEASRGEHGVKEWGMEEGEAGKWRNKRGEADRGRARSEGGSEGGIVKGWQRGEN